MQDFEDNNNLVDEWEDMVQLDQDGKLTRHGVGALMSYMERFKAKISEKYTAKFTFIFYVHVQCQVQINNNYCHALNDIDELRTICAEETNTKWEGRCFQLVRR